MCFQSGLKLKIKGGNLIRGKPDPLARPQNKSIMVDIVIKSNLKSIKQCISRIRNLNEVTLDPIEVSKHMN
jgi:hypothetical protein